MIVGVCRFNPARDLCPVSQTGFIDLNSAFASGVVPSVAPNADVDYNGIEDPGSILGKPHDVFEAIEMESYVKNTASSGPSEEPKE